MKNVIVLNKKNNVEGIAVELESGRFQITEGENVKEVAASTFKRWYKILGESVEGQTSLEELLADVEAVEEVAPVAVEEVAPVQEVEAVAEQLTTRGGKCDKVVTKLLFNNVTVVITEYNGYVCDVELVNPETNEVEYKSPKMSIKDALENGLGLAGEELKEARKQVISLKKQAKAAM